MYVFVFVLQYTINSVFTNQWICIHSQVILKSLAWINVGVIMALFTENNLCRSPVLNVDTQYGNVHVSYVQRHLVQR